MNFYNYTRPYDRMTDTIYKELEFAWTEQNTFIAMKNRGGGGRLKKY